MLSATFQLDAEFGKMFLGKEYLFLRKWEGHIVPKLLKVAALENDPNVLPAAEERDGKLPSMHVRYNDVSTCCVFIWWAEGLCHLFLNTDIISEENPRASS